MAQSLWASLLRSAQKKTKLSDANVVFCGDHGIGKQTLLKALQMYPLEEENVEQMPSTSALTYSFFDLFDPEDEVGDNLKVDVPAKVNIWSLGDSKHGDLLQFALKNNVESLHKTVVLICVNLARPWDIERRLNAWSKVVEDQLKSKLSKLPQEEQKFLNDCIRQYLQSYCEPRVTEDNNPPSNTEKNKQLNNFDELEDGVLIKNFGVPVIIVCTQSDCIDELVKSSKVDLSTAHFDYIQQYLRTWCIERGASLVYTSAKSGSNCELLRKYIFHRLYLGGIEPSTKRNSLLPIDAVANSIEGVDENNNTTNNVSTYQKQEKQQSVSKSSLNVQKSRKTKYSGFYKPFGFPAETSNHSLIFVPSGWDSFELIENMSSSLSSSNEDNKNYKFSDYVKSPKNWLGLSESNTKNKNDSNNSSEDTDITNIGAFLSTLLKVSNASSAARGSRNARQRERMNKTNTGFSSDSVTSERKVKNKKGKTNSKLLGLAKQKQRITAGDEPNAAVLADFFQGLIKRGSGTKKSSSRRSSTRNIKKTAP